MTNTARHDHRVRCTVNIRTFASGGKYRFDRLDHHTSQRGAVWEVMTPPQIGDLISLSAGLVRVVDRMWIFSEYGSPNWPRGHQEPLVGPSLDLIVEAVEGMYIDEAPATVPETPATAAERLRRERDALATEVERLRKEGIAMEARALALALCLEDLRGIAQGDGTDTEVRRQFITKLTAPKKTKD